MRVKEKMGGGGGGQDRIDRNAQFSASFFQFKVLRVQRLPSLNTHRGFYVVRLIVDSENTHTSTGHP